MRRFWTSSLADASLRSTVPFGESFNNCTNFLVNRPSELSNLQGEDETEEEEGAESGCVAKFMGEDIAEAEAVVMNPGEDIIFGRFCIRPQE